MFKTFDKTDLSYDDVARLVHGTPDTAGSIAKLNNDTDGEIIVFSDEVLLADGVGIRANIDSKVYNSFYDCRLIRSLTGARAAVLVFENGGFNFRHGQNAAIYNDNELFLTGNIKNIKPVLDNEHPIIQIEIKSKAGMLLDTVVPFPLEFHNVSLKKILTDVCGCFGIPVYFADDVRLDLISKNEIDNSFAAGLTEKAWDFLVRITSARGLFIRDTGNGLYVGNLIEEQKPVFSFIEGETIGVSSWLPDFNTENLARYYEAHSQTPETTGAIAQIPFNLPITKRIIKPDAVSGGIQNFADWCACKDIGKAFKVYLDLHERLSLIEGDYVILKSSSCYFFEETLMVIEDATALHPTGMEIVLTLPCVYTGIIPDWLPLC